MSTQQGTINVNTENIFPIIKKFLYSDHEIFLRELIANAVDASQKLRTYAAKGEPTGDIDDLTIQISVDKENGTLSISDKGIGMTKDEVKKYINQIAFSGAKEFLDKYKDESNIIGKFGLGFYSAFMVADKVDLYTKSYKANTKAAHWSCDGSPNYELDDNDKTERGTTIVLHINEESKEFLEEARIQTLLTKYCKFLPIEIQFGFDTQTEKDEEGKETSTETARIINNTQPAWTKKPSDLTDEDYIAFYKEMYPHSYEDPLFWIHLNVDYPFNLTGILYFPKLRNQIEVKKDNIGLYCNQVFVTDHVEEIVPEFLQLLHGVIDSPDIPLNVSRSYLQSDPNVKRISSYITKKVASKLEDIFKKDREGFESKWNDIGIFIKYGILSEEKFADKAKKFCLVKNLDKKYFTFEEYNELIKANQTDKNDKIVWLYTSQAEAQDSYVQAAKDKGYDVLEFNEIIDAHFISYMEQNVEGISLKRVDADVANQLIEKDEIQESVLNEEQEKSINELFKTTINQQSISIETKALSPDEMPVMITKPELMRRMQEINAYNQSGGNSMPEFYNLIINTNHPIISNILEEKDADTKAKTINQLFDLALLSQQMLKGSQLTNFIKRSIAAYK
ncbi:UNVERIFIED_CONTAM: hypothetical protein GTU68_027839 [Idotea baltica]|nr:hypothetical protein [Idotea baltica]